LGPQFGVKVRNLEGGSWPTAPFGHGRYRMMPSGALERNADISGVHARS
jgi:hypothetical protein